MKRMRLISVCLLLCLLAAVGQERFSISAYQDMRLGLMGDEHGNPAGTANVIVRLNYTTKQQYLGHFILFPEMEYANIHGIYRRFSGNVGYTLNRFPLKRLEATASAGYGFIRRYSVKKLYTNNLTSWSVSGYLSYRIHKHIKVNLLGQITERQDMLWLYGVNRKRFSGFFGLEFMI